MNAFGLSSDVKRLEAPASCSVVVVPEDVPAQKLALNVSDHLRAHFREDLAFDFSWWNFKFLGDQGMALAAHQEARFADIVLFSLHYESELPAEVKSWIESWTPGRPGQSGALALMAKTANSGTSPRPEVVEYLAGVAQRAEMDFLVLAGSAQDTPPADFPPDATSPPSGTESEWRVSPNSHWGINE